MGSFRLTRYFSLASLIGVAVVVALLVGFYRYVAFRELVHHETRNNAALTQAFANSIWPQYAAFVTATSGAARDELLARPEIGRLRADILRQMKGLSVVKVKIYNLDGLTVFSSDEKQIGEDKSANAGFLRARNGEIAGDLTFRGDFDAFEGTIHNRNLVFSYVPIRRAAASPVEGVFEVYSDVTAFAERLERIQWQIAAGVGGGLAILYVFLFALVRRAEGIIGRQERERVEREALIRHQAYHDPLTGLPNRISFAEHLGSAVSLAIRTRRLIGVMFIDVDRFKVVNDSLGHEAGDQLLQITARRIRRCLRESDMVFRMGGDEFTVILETLERPEDAAQAARRIIEAVSEPVKITEHEITVGASIGITICPTDDAQPEQLVRNADAAMYQAKESGRGRYEFYTREMNERAFERFSMESALQRALRKGEFLLYYQPRISTETGRACAVEALLRWNHPEKGVIPPAQFITVLEDTGLIVPVGEWVLATACRDNKAWQDAGLPPMRVSVNISSRQFRSETLVDAVENALRESGLAPQYLELELTESLLVENAERALSTMNRLKQLGVVISIDDFGTGYSSLNYLRRFPVDYLKIDRSFVSELQTCERDAAIAQAVAALARTLNIKVVAEGVEKREQAEFLRAEDCHELQGYLFSKPVPPTEIPALVVEGANLPADQNCLVARLSGTIAGSPDSAAEGLEGTE